MQVDKHKRRGIVVYSDRWTTRPKVPAEVHPGTLEPPPLCSVDASLPKWQEFAATIHDTMQRESTSKTAFDLGIELSRRGYTPPSMVAALTVLLGTVLSSCPVDDEEQLLERLFEWVREYRENERV